MIDSRKFFCYFVPPTVTIFPNKLSSVVAMKADVKIFKGIEYVIVGELPQLQQAMLLDTINHDLFIKIMIDGKIISQCLQYRDYSNWYEKNKTIESVASTEVATERVPVEATLALNKI